MFAVPQYRGPPSAAWISQTRAIRYQLNFFHVNAFLRSPAATMHEGS
jgi:hypothetical protein